MDGLRNLSRRTGLGERDRADVVVDWTPPRPEALWLCPRTLRAGVGCRRGTSEEAIRALFDRMMNGLGLPARAVGAVCSIDLKAEEPGLLAFAGALGLPLTVYPAGRLAQVEGSVSPLPFVAQVTGVDNVCERAALAEGGVLLKRKTARDGVTLALAGTEPDLDWRSVYEAALCDRNGPRRGGPADAPGAAGPGGQPGGMRLYHLYGSGVGVFGGKELVTTPMTRELERCRIALERAEAGETTAMICSGDAGVYGMAGPILQMAEEFPEVEIEVVPGSPPPCPAPLCWERR